jgi:diguanylate cyclase (GGDEF)-like protein
VTGVAVGSGAGASLGVAEAASEEVLVSEDVTRKREVDIALLHARVHADDNDGPLFRVSGPRRAPTLRPASAPKSEWAACLLIVHGRSGELPGKCFELRSPTTVGRSPMCDIFLEDALVSRQHARFERDAGGWRLVDRGSTNGTFCNGAPISQTALAHGDRIGIGSTIYKLLCEGDLLARYKEEIARMALSDGLTQASNMRRFYELLDEEVLPRGGRGAVVALDVDHLGRINSENGVMAGDLVLVEITRLAEPHLALDYTLAHFGAGRFVLFLPGASKDDATALAELLRRTVSEHQFVHDNDEIHVTISAGVAALEPADLSAYHILGRLDQKLSAAKRGGRDRVAA